MARAGHGIKALTSGTANYLGGKRDLAEVLFRAIRQADPAPPPTRVLVDAFAGSCSVSLIGKVMGYRVIANDTGARSEALGKALVENSHVQLDESDVHLALTTKPAGRYMPPVEHLMWPDDTREIMAGICAAADTYARPEKRWLLRALAVKTALTISQFGRPRMSVGRKARDGRHGDASSARQAKALRTLEEPRKVVLSCASHMYGRIFTNGQRNEMHRMDVLDFLSSVKGDIVYLDPPYPGTLAYEPAYIGIDALLDNRELDGVPSRFSADDGWKFIGEVLDAAEHIPTWVLSLGNEHVDLAALEAMMRERGREVEAMALDHAHLNSLATAAKTQRNQEYVLTGVRK